MHANRLQRYRRLLIAKREELSAANEAATPVPAADEPEGDLMERANADAEADLQIRLHATDGRLLKAIEDALARIRAGTFGVCEACKRPISNARLEAVPWTHLCRKCKEQRSA
ncbi:MAG: TraR/DksA C4-type zinc finger protein [Candidatus Acidiferrales bacterium]